MKKQLLKKLATFIVTAMMFSAVANAQIVYTDVIPDTTINTDGGVYALDLNNDGTNDFNITYSTTIISETCGGIPETGTNTYIRITPVVPNEVGCDPTYPSALWLNSNIDNSSFTWNDNANQLLSKEYWHCLFFMGNNLWLAGYDGNWLAAGDNYVPLRLHVSSQEYYGWVRLDVAAQAVSFTVKDYAYNTIPDQSILAGQTIGTGIIENSFASSINLFPNPTANHLTITLPNENEKVEVTITDITGKIIPIAIGTTIAGETQRIEVNTQDFTAGIYVVQIQAADFIATKKLIVKK